MGAVEQALGRLVSLNNRWIAEVPQPANPRPLETVAWNRSMESRHPAIAAEWNRFVDSGGRLPAIGDVLSEDQGNEGPWNIGLLVAGGRPVRPLADRFPDTLRALAVIPGLRSALWSVLEPGTRLPAHHGPNAGMLRYHLGVVCGEDSALRVGDRVEPYRDARGILFDDTAEHEAWNLGERPRVTLFCELYRPLRGRRRALNRLTQAVIGLDPRYRHAPGRAAAWHRTLNPGAQETTGASSRSR